MKISIEKKIIISIQKIISHRGMYAISFLTITIFTKNTIIVCDLL